MVDWDPFADPAEETTLPKFPKETLPVGPLDSIARPAAGEPPTEEEMMDVMAAAFGLDEAQQPRVSSQMAFQPADEPRATVDIVELTADADGPKAIRSSNWQAGVVPSSVRNSVQRKSAAVGGKRPSVRPSRDLARDIAALERSLWEQTDGLYNPAVMAKRRRPPSKSSRVSVVTPTSDLRSQFHQNLWAMFREQRWADKELIVVETYQSAPSSFFPQMEQQHPDLLLVQLRGDLTTGVKRNIGVHLASGSVVVNFDDDDIYAPEYIEVLAGHLLRENLVGLTLSTWYDFDVRHCSCGFVDPEAAHELDLLPREKCELDSWKNSPEFAEIREEYVSRSVYGYGFSFVHLREVALQYPYPNKSFGEDLPFMQQLRNAFDGRVGLLRDECGLVLHFMHGGNTADSAVHFRLTPKQMGGLAVSSLESVKAMLAECERRYVWNEFGSGFQRIGKFRASQLEKHEVQERQLSKADRLLAWLRRRAAGRREAGEGEEPPPDFVEL